MQRYNWTGTYNTRDIGYTPTVKGGIIQYGRFIRSDAPCKISDETKTFLAKENFKTIIDLRNKNVASKNPNVFEKDSRFSCFNFPLSVNLKVPYSEDDVIRNYYDMLENQQAIKEIFQTMANSNSNILFHCQEGKDRTGIISAILLLIAEVSDIDIYADYAVSNVYLYEMIKIAKTIPNGIPNYLLYVKPEYMEMVLTYLRKKYETIENYLLTKEVSHFEIDKLKKKLLE